MWVSLTARQFFGVALFLNEQSCETSGCHWYWKMPVSLADVLGAFTGAAMDATKCSESILELEATFLKSTTLFTEHTNHNDRKIVNSIEAYPLAWQ